MYNIHMIEAPTNPFFAIIHRDGAGYGASFPDAPGCLAVAPTLEALKDEAAGALRSHIDVSIETGLARPVARSLDTVLADPQVQEDVSDAYATLEVWPKARSGKVKRINLTVDEFALDQIDRAAGRIGLTRSAFMVRSALKLAESHDEDTAA